MVCCDASENVKSILRTLVRSMLFGIRTLFVTGKSKNGRVNTCPVGAAASFGTLPAVYDMYSYSSSFSFSWERRMLSDVRIKISQSLLAQQKQYPARSSS